MCPGQTHHQLTLTNALSRVQRASDCVEVTLRTHRLEVLARHHRAGQQYLHAVMRFVDQQKKYPHENEELTGPTVSASEVCADAITRAFFGAPAQRLASPKVEGPASTPPRTAGAGSDSDPKPAENVSYSSNLGEQSWGAFCLGRVLGCHPDLTERRSEPKATSDLQQEHIALKDLAFMECAIHFMEQDLDYAFMKHLSEAGANTVHRIALILANEFSIRVDNAIATSARLLLDPLIGGDAYQCICILKGRHIPEAWRTKYNLRS